MSTPLYLGEIIERTGSTIRLRLTATHPGGEYGSEFGNDAVFAWKLLSDWVSPATDGDESELATRYITAFHLELERGMIADEDAVSFRVRPSEHDPSVIYRIEVSDPALIAHLHAGQRSDVYQFPATPPRKKKVRARPEVAVAPKTFEDLRDTTMELLRAAPNRSWSEYLMPSIVRWSADASDSLVRGWLDALDAGHAAQGYGLVAVERARAGALEAARELLAHAESLISGDKYERAVALAGVVPARWRCGDDAAANIGFHELAATLEERGRNNQSTHALLTAAARGGQWDRVLALVPYTLVNGSHGADRLVGGLVIAFEERSDVFDQIATRWGSIEDRSNKDRDRLTTELLHHARGTGTLVRYLDAVARHPSVLDVWSKASWALGELERHDNDAAFLLAQRLLADEKLGLPTRARALALVADRQPARAEAFIASGLPDHGLRFVYLAAAGRHREARAGLTDKHARKYYLGDLAIVTTDRQLAIDALRASVPADLLQAGPALVQLAQLGDRPAIDTMLDATLADIAKLRPQERDMRCRSLAGIAGMLGRFDLGAAACKLPTASVRDCSVSELVSGCASVGDYTGALVALALVRDTSDNGRLSTAIQRGIRVSEQAFFDGPLARRIRIQS